MNEMKRVGSLELSSDGPTELRFDQLGDWVIWQFPPPRSDWLCGAVHPPTAEYGWLPALIQPQTECIQIHAHQTGPFATPEEAADWMASIWK